MLPPRPHVASWPLIGVQTKFGRAGDLPNVITHAKFQIEAKPCRASYDLVEPQASLRYYENIFIGPVR